jgi:hypothetical protein
MAKWYTSDKAPSLLARGKAVPVVVKTDRQEGIGTYLSENLCGEGIAALDGDGNAVLDTVYCRNVPVWKMDSCIRIGDRIVKRLTSKSAFMWRYLEDESEPSDGDFAL